MSIKWTFNKHVCVGVSVFVCDQERRRQRERERERAREEGKREKNQCIYDDAYLSAILTIRDSRVQKQ